MKRPHERWIELFLIVILACPAWALSRTGVETPISKQPKGPAESPVTFTGVRYDSDNRRDPFLNPTLLRKKAENQDEEVDAPSLVPPGIAGMYIAQVQLLGISARQGNQTAVFQGRDKRAYFLREGDRLFDGFLKKIEVDSVLLVRETKMRSGKVLTQDVTKRLRIQ